MSKQRGMLLTCHRCGKTVFLAYKGRGYFAGDFTQTDEFEEKPEGWSCKFPDEDGNGNVDLCKECTEEFMKSLYIFYGYGG